MMLRLGYFPAWSSAFIHSPSDEDKRKWAGVSGPAKPAQVFINGANRAGYYETLVDAAGQQRRAGMLFQSVGGISIGRDARGRVTATVPGSWAASGERLRSSGTTTFILTPYRNTSVWAHEDVDRMFGDPASAEAQRRAEQLRQESLERIGPAVTPSFGDYVDQFGRNVGESVRDAAEAVPSLPDLAKYAKPIALGVAGLAGLYLLYRFTR